MNKSGNTIHATSPELLPCPFCGDEETIVAGITQGGGLEWGYVSCECGAEIHDGATETEAVARWNTRSQPQSLSTSEDAINALSEAQLALEPIARRVFNDNGDHTIDSAPFDADVYSACYYAARTVAKALAALKSKEQSNEA